jgi:hypothetical protein
MCFVCVCVFASTLTFTWNVLLSLENEFMASHDVYYTILDIGIMVLLCYSAKKRIESSYNNLHSSTAIKQA